MMRNMICCYDNCSRGYEKAMEKLCMKLVSEVGNEHYTSLLQFLYLNCSVLPLDRPCFNNRLVTVNLTKRIFYD